MTQRITERHLQAKVDTLNRLTGTDPDAPYSTIGKYVLSGDYGGTDVHRYCNESGGVSSLLGGHVPKREVARFLDGMLAALYDMKESTR